MSDETPKSINRRDVLKIISAFGAGALGKSAIDTLKPSPEGNIIQAYESRRQGTPVVARMELIEDLDMNSKLRDLIDKEGTSLTAVLDAPTDVVTRYVEILGVTGEQLPTEIQDKIVEAVSNYRKTIYELLNQTQNK